MSAPARVAVDTNVFELCELTSVAWRVFEAPMCIDACGTEDKQTAFAALAQLVTQSGKSVFAWESDDGSHTCNLWVFSVNNAQPLPTDATVTVVTHGEWQVTTTSLPTDVIKHLFRALQGRLAKSLLAHSEFRFEKELFTRNEARFVYRTPSTTRVDEFHMFLDEEVSTVGFQLHFQLLPCTNVLCVNLEMIHRDSLPAMQPELGSLSSAWMRLMGLPRDFDHSMVDVWHLEEGLVPRMVADTKYEDIYPRFRSIPRRKLKRHAGEDGADGTGGSEGDGAKSKEDGNDTAEDSAQDADADRDESGLRNGKKKRKKNHPDMDNDESIVPVSPDTHVNSPDASGPVVCMTFPFDHQSSLHVDDEVHVYKRRRRQKSERGNSRVSLSFESATGNISTVARAVSKADHVNSLLATPKKHEVAKPPALRLAVSLVASLTQDEKQEALDSKPVKVHPLLQALDDYVEKEMNGGRARGGDASAGSHVRLVPIGPAFSPPLDGKTLKKPSIPEAVIGYETLKNHLLSNRFKKWLTGYAPRDHRRSKKQRRRDRERRALLEYDELKLTEYRGQSITPQDTIMCSEIAIGIRLAARFALTPWMLLGKASQRWTPFVPFSRAADTRDMTTLVTLVNPHLTQLQGLITARNSDATSDDEAGEVRDSWLTLDTYLSKTKNNAGEQAELRPKSLDGQPKVCISSIGSSLHVEIPAISEYLLRNFQPVSAPKPFDYCVVCPVSPSQWLGTLALSYLSMFKNVYAQASLGDQVPLDLSGLSASSTVHVDASNAILLVECATSSQDAFASYRAVGELLRPLLSQTAKSKQAFARSPITNVVYLIAPFRRFDIKHKMWLLGALARGLVGDDGLECLSSSITIELVYLEDLIDVSVDTNPFALLPAAMALYDRVFESVTLKPITAAPAQATPPRTRLVCERLYHLSAPETASEAEIMVHVGYAVSPDGKWLITSFTDAVGSLLESKTIPVVAEHLATALLSLVESAFEFVALVGEKATLAISRLSSVVDSNPEETEAWNDVASQDAFMELMARYESVVSKILVFHVSFVSKEFLQVRRRVGSLALIGDRESALIMCPDPPGSLREWSRIANAAWLRSTRRPRQETAVMRVELMHSSSNGCSDTEMETLVTDLSALSYLTVHPVILERQSPLPLHLAVVDELTSELELLGIQLSTDPIELRR